jgi:hypothetical protein
MSHHPLAGVVEKLRNADDHLHRLQAETLLYLNSGPNASILGERDANNSGRGCLRFNVIREPPLKLAAIAGDVVHNLRSALDYFIEELVKRDGHTPTFQHLYPICATPEGFTQALKSGRLYGVHKRAVRFIEGIQPYQVNPEARPKHPLIHLHQLSNRDKHHMLAISALNAEFVWSFVDQSGRVLRSDKTTERKQHGGILADLPTEFVIDGSKVQLQSQLSITVGFNEPAFEGFDVAGCLDRIREFIGLYMLPAFERFFDPLPDDLRLTSHGLTSPSKPVEMLMLVRDEPSTPSPDSTEKG